MYIMRILVDIPEPQLAKLTAISKAKKLPRAEIIRQAISTYIETQPIRPEDVAFGIWVKVVFDTNILIDVLNGHERAREEVRRHSEKAVSVITWIEVMAGATEETGAACRTLLAVFERLELTPPVAERSILLRRESRLKLPDAVILATAQIASSTLITRNIRDFPANAPGIRVPYEL